jgi:hypothetical protein
MIEAYRLPAPASRTIPAILTGRKPGEPPPTLFEYLPATRC